MVFPPQYNEKELVKIERLAADQLLSSCSPHLIYLEEQEWLSCEHYYSYKIVRSATVAEQILAAPTGKDAYQLAKPWYRYKVAGWKKMRVVLMTRALYTKVQMYPQVKQALLETGGKKIIETSQYDHFWGCGRDMRGNNEFGKIWMSIRKKLLESGSEQA